MTQGAGMFRRLGGAWREREKCGGVGSLGSWRRINVSGDGA